MGLLDRRFLALVLCEPPVFWLAYRHAGRACGHVNGVTVGIYSVHGCFSKRLGILSPCGQPLCLSEGLGTSNPAIYLSTHSFISGEFLFVLF